MVEPMTAAVATAAVEKASETALQETFRHMAEIGRRSSEWSEVGGLRPDPATLERVDALLDQENYRKLNEFRELSRTHPEAVQAAYDNVHLKGQMGECLMEAKLSQYGEVLSQVPVQLSGAETGNRIDLILTESNANLKQIELKVQDGQVVMERNYDLMKGESAAFEVKNGSSAYLRQELASGELQQQIAAGAAHADHSFVVINEDTAAALLDHPEQAAKAIEDIQAAGGKLIVGLPSQSVQMAIFLG